MTAQKTFDLSSRGWGKDYNIMSVSHIAGWSRGISVGDYLILKSGDYTTRYKVGDINYCSDPHDMFFAKIEFAPRDPEQCETLPHSL